MAASTILPEVSRFTKSRRILHDEVRNTALGAVPPLESGPREAPFSDAFAKRLGWESGVFYRNLRPEAFSNAVADFLRATFLRLSHLRPGKFLVRDAHSDSLGSIAECEQYQHLARLAALLKERPELAADLGGDYLVKPDIVITREAEPDGEINRADEIVDDTNARLAPLRAANNPTPALLLHASISCKWTIRSDRVQNSRSEALNLIRNRKGRVPHIVAVTAEPTPLRLVSLALGESDLDCVYHIALPELREAVKKAEGRTAKDHLQALNMLVEGRRLRDISDLPLDLAV